MTPRKATPCFGRLVALDARDKAFPLRAAIRQAVADIPASRTWSMRNAYALNQGAHPRCVGYSCAHFLASAPRLHPVHDSEAVRFYEAAQTLDEWEGTDYDGTSVRGGMKALQLLGLISEYRWAQTERDLELFVRSRGPAVVGTLWLTGMMDTDAKGYVNLTGGEEGGHAWLIVGYSATRKAYRALNSWGTEWGQDGRFWVRQDDMRALLEDLAGEASSAIETAAS